MQKQYEELGDIIKRYRITSGRTIESVAEDVGISSRYLYLLENQGKKPSYDVLVRLIRKLGINPDLIFYPEKPARDSEVEDLLRLLYACDNRSLEVVKATVKALINSSGE